MGGMVVVRASAVAHHGQNCHVRMHLKNAVPQWTAGDCVSIERMRAAHPSFSMLQAHPLQTNPSPKNAPKSTEKENFLCRAEEVISFRREGGGGGGGRRGSKQGHKGRKTNGICDPEKGKRYDVVVPSRFKTGERYDQNPRRTFPQPWLRLYSANLAACCLYT